MAKLIIKCGANTAKADITGKSAFSVLRLYFPDGIDPETTTVIYNGQNHKLIDFSLDREFESDVTLLMAPKGIEILVIAAIGIVAAFAAVALMAPDIPETSSGKQSPNNGFQGQTNQVRLDALEPNIYGRQISYPDIITQEGGFWEYDSEYRKKIKEAFLIGQGEYQVNSSAKYESTPLSDIPGSSSNVYDPGDTIPTIYGQFNSEAVDGQALPGLNNSDWVGGDTANANTATDPDFNAVVTNIDGISFTLTVTGIDERTEWDTLYNDYASGGGFDADFTYNATTLNGNVTSMTYDAVEGQYTITIFAYGVASSGGTSLQVTKLTENNIVNVTMPKVTDELQVSFDFRRGLRGTAKIQVTASTLSGGVSITNTYVYDDDTSSQRFFTEREDISTINAANDGLVVTVKRTNDDKDDNTDSAQLSQVAVNSYRNSVVYDDVTILTTDRTATESATKFSRSKINIDVTRKTISYDTGTGEIINTLAASRKFSDAILHEYSVIAGQEYSDLPLDEIYEISDRIGALGYFDGTFDDKYQGLKERLGLIANTARCLLPFVGNGWEVYRDEQRYPAGQIESRQMSAETQNVMSFTPSTENSNDGVRLKYRNPATNKLEYIYFLIDDGVAYECVWNGSEYSPSKPLVPLEVDLFGCFDRTQAVDRGYLEARKIIHRFKSLEVVTLGYGDNFKRGQLLKYADYYQDDVASGEIKTITAGDGVSTFTTFGDIKVSPGEYVVTYVDEYGEVNGPVACTVIDSETFTANMPDAYLANGYTVQLGTTFIISAQSLHDVSLFEIQDKIINTDGTVTLNLTQYSDEFYS